MPLIHDSVAYNPMQCVFKSKTILVDLSWNVNGTSVMLFIRNFDERKRLKVWSLQDIAN